MVRPCSCPASQRSWQGAPKTREHAMSQTPNTAIAVIGIDIGKNSFHVVGHDARGAIVLRQKWSRGQVEARLANIPPCLIGMEACVGAHHLSRKLASLGHDARLMPAKYVRPYSRGQKNDFNDAEAIADEVRGDQDRGATGSAGAASGARAAGIATHRHHQPDSRLHAGTRDRRAPGYRLPAHGTAHYPCDAHRRPVATRVACHRGTGRRLAPAGSAYRWRVRRDRSTGPSRSGVFAPDDGARHRADHFERDGGRDRTGDVFSKGRDFGAWLGLVPKQISTGDRTILGNISRRGNRYLRVLFVQAAWVVLVKIKNWERYGLKSWIEAAKRRLHHNVLAIALANKLARIAWAVLAKGRAFELTRTDDASVRPA